MMNQLGAKRFKIAQKLDALLQTHHDKSLLFKRSFQEG